MNPANAPLPDPPGPLDGFLVTERMIGKAGRLSDQSVKLGRAVELITEVAKASEPGDPDLTGHLAIAMAGVLDANSLLMEELR